MRRIAVLLVLLFTLEACGTKGSLYLPPAEPAPQSDLKPKQ